MASAKKMLKIAIASLAAFAFACYVSYILHKPRPEDAAFDHQYDSENGTPGRVKLFQPPLHFTHQPPPCVGPDQSDGKRVNFVAAVLSKATNFEARNTIRQTWGSEASITWMAGGKSGNNAARLIFLLAMDTNQTDIDRESENYGDILQINFQDSYANLPLKVIAAMEWFKDHCPGANFLLKIDDDVFLNPFLLQSRVIADIKDTQDMAIYGRAWKGSVPLRSKDIKWYVSEEQYPGSVFPTYVSGPAYLITGTAVPSLYEAVQKFPLMPLEDVYITGIVAEAAGVPVVGMGENFYDDAGNIGLGSEEKKCAAVNSFVAIHHSNPNRLRELWKLLWSDNSTICSKYTWSDKNWSLRKSYLGRAERKPK